MAEIVSREIRLKQRPVGMPKESDFEIVEVTVPEPKAGGSPRKKHLHVGRSLHAWSCQKCRARCTFRGWVCWAGCSVGE